MGVPDTYLCVNQGRVVDNLDDVDGDVILLANPDFSFMAQEVCAAVNRGLNNLFMTIDGVGAICVDARVLYSLRYHLKGRRVLVISLASRMTSMKPDVVMTLRPSTEMLDGHPESAGSFYKTILRVLKRFQLERRDSVRCVVHLSALHQSAVYVSPHSSRFRGTVRPAYATVAVRSHVSQCLIYISCCRAPHIFRKRRMRD